MWKMLLKSRKESEELLVTFPIEPLLVFVNPAFTLLQAPLHSPIIHPSQINRLLRKLSNNPSNTSHLHKKIVDKLLSNHIHKSPISRKPEYSYETLQKGICCSTCYRLGSQAKESKLVCKCGTIEELDQAIIRSVHEFLLLFPDRKVTTNAIYDWCGEAVRSKKTVRRVLSQNFKKMGYKQITYFILDK